MNTNERPAPLWAAVESQDPARFMVNLRALGCPEQTIRDVVTFRLCRENRDRLLALKTEWTRSWDYTRYRPSSEGSLQHQQEIELRNALDRDLETLLGVSAHDLKRAVFGLPGSSDYPEYLALETRAKVRDLDLRYRRLHQEAQQGLLSREGNDAFQARVAELDAQKQTELATLLTPHELEMHKLHLSPAAQYALEYLPEAQSEDEFRKLTQAVEEVGLQPPWLETTSFSQRYGFGDGKDMREKVRKQADQKARLQARLKELLGEQRFAELMQANQVR